jgi:hypothetical protein
MDFSGLGWEGRRDDAIMHPNNAQTFAESMVSTNWARKNMARFLRISRCMRIRRTIREKTREKSP